MVFARSDQDRLAYPSGLELERRLTACPARWDLTYFRTQSGAGLWAPGLASEAGIATGGRLAEAEMLIRVLCDEPRLRDSAIRTLCEVESCLVRVGTDSGVLITHNLTSEMWVASWIFGRVSAEGQDDYLVNKLAAALVDDLRLLDNPAPERLELLRANLIWRLNRLILGLDRPPTLH